MIEGIESYYFLFGLAFVWIVFATFQDLKKREVANWLNFSLIAFALAYRAFYASFSGDAMFFVFGVIGFAMFFGLAHLFYYTGVFAGGDAKLLMGLGIILPYSSFLNILFVGLGFIILLFTAGAIYSLIYSVFLARKHYTKFSSEFGKRIGGGRKWLFVLLFILVFMIIFNFVLGVDFILLIVGIIFAIFVFVLLIYTKSLDACMFKLVHPSKLTEGDWIAGDIRIGRSVIVKNVHGLSIGEIAKLRKKGKKVLIKEGIPFVPAFLATFLIMVFFLVVLRIDPALFFPF